MCGTLFTTRMETRTFTLCFMIQIFGVMLERVKVMQDDSVSHTFAGQDYPIHVII